MLQQKSFRRMQRSWGIDLMPAEGWLLSARGVWAMMGNTPNVAGVTSHVEDSLAKCRTNGPTLVKSANYLAVLLPRPERQYCTAC